jgi:hypothetical protein
MEIPEVKNDDPAWSYPCWYAVKPKIVMAFKIAQKVSVITPIGPVEANPNDRVVKDPETGHLSVVKPQDFVDNYYGVAEKKG